MVPFPRADCRCSLMLKLVRQGHRALARGAMCLGPAPGLRPPVRALRHTDGGGGGRRALSMFQVSQTGDSDRLPVIQRLAIRRRVPGFVDWRRMCQVSWTELQAGRVRGAAAHCGIDGGKSGPWQRCGSRFRGLSPLILAPVHETWVPVQETWNTDTRATLVAFPVKDDGYAG